MTAAQRKRIAVMVARGDLGVEIGFERLAEVQEEMLWLCEAAQVPVIWATQVLESLAKNGLPSRGEVTDAAMSTRAECVMLNKGPYIGHALRFLADVSRPHDAAFAEGVRNLPRAHGRGRRDGVAGGRPLPPGPRMSPPNRLPSPGRPFSGGLVTRGRRTALASCLHPSDIVSGD